MTQLDAEFSARVVKENVKIIFMMINKNTILLKVIKLWPWLISIKIKLILR